MSFNIDPRIALMGLQQPESMGDMISRYAQIKQLALHKKQVQQAMKAQDLQMKIYEINLEKAKQDAKDEEATRKAEASAFVRIPNPTDLPLSRPNVPNFRDMTVQSSPAAAGSNDPLSQVTALSGAPQPAPAPAAPQPQWSPEYKVVDHDPQIAVAMLAKDPSTAHLVPKLLEKNRQQRVAQMQEKISSLNLTKAQQDLLQQNLQILAAKAHAILSLDPKDRAAAYQLTVESLRKTNPELAQGIPAQYTPEMEPVLQKMVEDGKTMDDIMKSQEREQARKGFPLTPEQVKSENDKNLVRWQQVNPNKPIDPAFILKPGATDKEALRVNQDIDQYVMTANAQNQAAAVRSANAQKTSKEEQMYDYWAQKLVDGDPVALNDIFSLKGNGRAYVAMKAEQLAKQQGKSYNPRAVSRALDLYDTYTGSKNPGNASYRSIDAINVALGHTGVLSKAVDILDNGTIQQMNALANFVGVEVGGSDKKTSFDLIVHRLAPELVKAYVGGEGSEKDREKTESDFSSSRSHQALRGNVKFTANLLRSKLSSMEFNWNKTVKGLKGFESFEERFITPEARAVLDEVDPNRDQWRESATPGGRSTGSGLPVYDRWGNPVKNPQ